MTKETITLSQRELDRVWMMDAVIAKRLRQREAARQPGRSVRQVKRLVRRYREAGPRGLVSGHRGKTAGNAKAPSVRQAALTEPLTRTIPVSCYGVIQRGAGPERFVRLGIYHRAVALSMIPWSGASSALSRRLTSRLRWNAGPISRR